MLLPEYKEMRGNSWDFAAVVPMMSDDALAYAIENGDGGEPVRYALEAARRLKFLGADEPEAAHNEGYETAIKELEAGTADHRSAKTRGLYLNNQTFRIAWDCGYEAAIMAWRLGYDPKELARMSIYDASPVTTAATIRELESGRKLLRPDPRKTDGND